MVQKLHRRALGLAVSAALFMGVGQAAWAQEARSAEAQIREALATELPVWWRIESLESTAVEPMVVAVAEQSSKRPGDTTSADKPRGQEPGPNATHEFSAQLVLTDDLFEARYSMGGAALVDPIMESGQTLALTGTYGPDQDPVVDLHQGGVTELGTPLDWFETPAHVIGSPEAEAFLEELEATRADGTMSKLMNDEGDEL